MSDSSTHGIKTVLHPVSDLEKAKAVYTALLGTPPQHDAPYYVGYDVDGQHIGLVPDGASQGMTSPVAYWHVPDIEAKLAEVTAAGATVKEPAHEVAWGRIVGTVTNPDGNVLGLLQDRGGTTPAPAPADAATPSIGSPTTSTSGWRVPRRTVRRTWFRCPSTGTGRHCSWPPRGTAPRAGIWSAPGSSGSAWAPPVMWRCSRARSRSSRSTRCRGIG